jgi:predicted O-linked N-acetylglucosamine transferase (SPINDLY family)
MATLSEAFAIAQRHYQAGRLDVADEICRRVLDVEPSHHGALNLAGSIALRTGRWDAAADYLSRAVAGRPTDPRLHNNLGEAYRSLARHAEAIASYRRAVALRPDYVHALNNLGIALQAVGQFEEAVACCEQAVRLQPELAVPHSNLGNGLLALGQVDRAVEHYRRAVALNPAYVEAYANLGTALRQQGHAEEAVACFQRAIELAPGSAAARSDLGVALTESGRLEDAVTQFQRAIELDPASVTAHSSLVYLLQFSPTCDSPSLHESLRRWNRQFAEPLARSIAPHANDRSPQRRLRIGYVTFGCLSNPLKINAGVLQLWAQVLDAVERSSLVVLAPSGPSRQRISDTLSRHGISRSRVTFVDKQARGQYLEAYYAIDIGLDIFPYNGHTTSLDSFWMGVPVVTLVGQIAAGRAGRRHAGAIC